MEIELDIPDKILRYNLYMETGIVLPIQIDINIPISYSKLIYKPGSSIQDNIYSTFTDSYVICEMSAEYLIPKWKRYKKIQAYINDMPININGYEYRLRSGCSFPTNMSKTTRTIYFLISSDCPDYKGCISNIICL